MWVCMRACACLYFECAEACLRACESTFDRAHVGVNVLTSVRAYVRACNCACVHMCQCSFLCACVLACLCFNVRAYAHACVRANVCVQLIYNVLNY